MSLQSVRMVYLRPGREYLYSKAVLTDLSLRDKSHGPSGDGTAYSPSFDAIFVWPPIEDGFDSLQDFLDSDPLPMSGDDYQQAALFGEWEHWTVPLDPTTAIGPREMHDEALMFYGASFRHNAVAAASKDPTGGNDPYRHPLNWAAAAFVTLCGGAFAFMGVMFAVS